MNQVTGHKWCKWKRTRKRGYSNTSTTDDTIDKAMKIIMDRQLPNNC